jgi:hypothetical protein
MKKIKEITNIILTIIFALAILDISIVLTGLAQLALENRTGEWPTFWAVQAKFIINLFN